MSASRTRTNTIVDLETGLADEENAPLRAWNAGITASEGLKARIL